ncbi:MAG: siderophore biosynthesis protein, partial [Pseudonocardiaceae bacterium]|nr:siderophore biosynthesis protein [Pseudonocardiaceae bacterium]
MTTATAAPGRPDAAAPHNPAGVADAAGTQALLRCWVRETGIDRPSGGVLRLDLAVAGAGIEAPVVHWSDAGWHRFGPARFAGGAPVDAVT